MRDRCIGRPMNSGVSNGKLRYLGFWKVVVFVSLLTTPICAQELIFEEDFESGGICHWIQAPPAAGCSTATPSPIDSVLINPGMGFANFHFGWWCNLPPVDFTPQVCADRTFTHWPENYPGAGTAYFRWNWKEIEPVRGEIDFHMIDTAIQSANLMNETFSFRIMTISVGGHGVPDWLLQAPYNVPGQILDGTFWPDYRDTTYQAEHQRLISALGARYDGHPAIDHIDIGTVGCWGEWNTACLEGVSNVFEVFNPQNNADRELILSSYQTIIDHHQSAFPNTSQVMLELSDNPLPGERDWSLETFLHAIENGSGWRVDCWGDWGFFGGNWNHMEDLYPQLIANATAAYPEFPNVYQHAPIQLEICGTMPDWLAFGWTADAPNGEVYRTFQWALEQHASVLNAKFTPIPIEYVSAIEDLLKKNGYRFSIDRLSHNDTVASGGDLLVSSTWSNLGVAPIYIPRTLTYRIVGTGYEAQFESAADVRTWLPGTWAVQDTLAIPSDTPSGTYALEVALLDRAGIEPTTLPLPPLAIAITGRTPDGWYPLTQLVVIND